MTPEELAETFHTTYERLAPGFGWNGPRVTRCAWADLPANNRALMVATAREVLARVSMEAREAVRRDLRHEQRRLGKPEARFMVD